MTQEELLPLLQKKDQKAFTLLYDMYSKSLYGIILILIKDKEDSEDVLQEVFVKIWKNIDSYNEDKGRLYTWMLNITRNACIDRLRSKHHHNQLKNFSADNFVHVFENNKSTVTYVDSIGVREFIRKLKPACIRIIDLLYFKGYTQKEVSEELEIPLGTVKTQNRNCINQLRSILGIQ